MCPDRKLQALICSILRDAGKRGVGYVYPDRKLQALVYDILWRKVPESGARSMPRPVSYIIYLIVNRNVGFNVHSY